MLLLHVLIHILRIRHVLGRRCVVRYVLGLRYVIRRSVKRATELQLNKPNTSVPSFTKLFYNMSYLML